MLTSRSKGFGMSARKLDGKSLAATLRAEVAAGVAERIRLGKRPPGLVAILVGDNPASAVYVRNKYKACQEAGLASWIHQLPTDTTQNQLLNLINTLNTAPEVMVFWCNSLCPAKSRRMR